MHNIDLIFVYLFICCQLRVSEEGGLCVDAHMQTSAQDVYAAGDVCTATWERAELWQQVYLV